MPILLIVAVHSSLLRELVKLNADKPEHELFMFLPLLVLEKNVATETMQYFLTVNNSLNVEMQYSA